MEIWKDVVGYEGLYQVSSEGRIKGIKQGRGCRGLHRKKFLPKKDGRERTCLRKDGKNKFTFVSRVVAQAFLPNPHNKPDVDHINHDVTNNHVSNLRWATKTENQANKRPTRALPKGVRLWKNGRYNAYASYKGKFINLGYYGTADEAASNVVAFQTAQFGDFYCAQKPTV